LLKRRSLDALRPGILLAPLLTFSCSGTAVGPEEKPSIPQQLGDGWEVSSLEENGLDPAELGALSTKIREGGLEEIHGLLIARHGKLVFEEYYQPGHGVDLIHPLYSVTKSVISALIGIAIREGMVQGHSQRIATFFPEHADLFEAGSAKADLELWHALTMTAGLEWKDYPFVQSGSDTDAMHASPDAVRYVLEQLLVAPPGTQFVYSDGLSMLLSGVIRNVSGLQADEFAERHLFQPLGIADTQWQHHQDGLAEGDAGLWMTARDLARFGLLYLAGGQFGGEQIVPEEWVQLSVSDWTVSYEPDRYGFQWWLSSLLGVDGLEPGPADIFSARGYGGQQLSVIPDLDMIVVMLGCCPVACSLNHDLAVVHAFYDYILPAVRP